MAIDWERVIVESDDNGVVVSSGQVSLLIGADADSVSWGNITGDITQQPDLMQIVDGYVSADSPTFTGTPRSVTPPEGNNSTRIATTAFVQGEMTNVRRDVSDKVNEAPINNHIWGRKDENWAQLGEMATIDEPAHGISSSEPQRFVRTKEPDGDMIWEEVGTMAMLDAPDSLTPNITYGFYNGEMVNIDPTPNGSATKKYWLRTNEVIKEGEHTGDRDPKWEQAGSLATVDDVQDNQSSKTKYYFRSSRYDQDSDKILKEWSIYEEPENLGEMAYIDDAPRTEFDSGRVETPICYRRNGEWIPVKVQRFIVDNENGDDTTGDGSFENPYKSITKALDQIVYAGTISIKPGFYDEKVLIDSKTVTIEVDPPAGVQPVDAENIEINELSLYKFANVNLVGNFKVYGNVELQIGSNLCQRTGKLTIYDTSSHPSGSTVKQLRAIWIENSTMSVKNLEVTWGNYDSCAVEVTGSGHFVVNNISAYLHKSSATIFETLNGGIIQCNTVSNDSTYKTLKFNDTAGLIIGGTISS